MCYQCLQHFVIIVNIVTDSQKCLKFKFLFGNIISVNISLWGNCKFTMKVRSGIMEKFGAIAEYLGAWLKELIHTFMEAMDWLEINFGGEAE